MERYFQISFHALILTAFVALAETGRLDVPSILVFLVCFAVTGNRALRRRPPLLTARGAFYLSLGYIVFFALDATLLSGSFIAAVIHLILFLEIAKLAQAKKDKDYLYLILLAFLQILAASSLTIDVSFVFTLLFFLVALISTLMSFDIHRAEREAIGPESVGITAPLGSMSVWASAWIVIIGVVLFFTIPRIGTGYFSRAEVQALLLSGFSDTVELGAIGEVKLSSALVMRTRTLNGSSSTARKWRGLSLDTFDGRAWSKANRQRDRVRPTGQSVYELQNPNSTGERVEFQVFLEPLATPTLFGPYIIRTIIGDFRGLERDDADSVYQRIGSVRRTVYQVVSELPIRRVATAPPDGSPGPTNVGDSEPALSPPEGFDVYLQVPPDLDPRIAALAADITGPGDTVLAKAALMETYLKTNYRYSLELTWDPGQDPLSTFLFDARSGHCEYFASSMAIMLRTVGIPTRIVNGFLPGEYNSIGDSYIIRQSDAHSWLEVYVPDQGWMDFDPTPPNPDRGEISLLVLLSHYVDAAKLFWNAYILTYDSASQFQLFQSAQDTVQAAQNSLQDQSSSWSERTRRFADQLTAGIRSIVESPGFWFLAGSVGLGVFAFRQRSGIRDSWKIWNLRHGRGDADRDVVTRLFYRAAALAGHKSGIRLPHQTWREWTTRLPDDGRRRLIGTALEIFENARYGDAPVTAEDYARLENTVQRLKAGGSV